MKIGRSLGFLVVAFLAAVVAQPAEARLVYQRAGTKQIVVAANDGSGARVVARGFAPALSPDGRRVAFFRAAAGVDERLYVVKASGGRPLLVARRVDASQAEPASLDWAPDGRALAVGRRGGVGVLVDLARDRRMRVRGDPFYVGAAFSPGGRRAVVVLASVRIPHLVLVTLGRERRREIALGDYPVWGKPGIAFHVDRGIALKPRPRARARLIVRFDRDRSVLPLAWSGDGRTLLIGAGKAILVRPDGSNPQTLDVPFNSITGISHDGEEVLGRVGSDVVVARRDGTSRVVASNAEYPTWAP